MMPSKVIEEHIEIDEPDEAVLQEMLAKHQLEFGPQPERYLNLPNREFEPDTPFRRTRLPPIKPSDSKSWRQWSSSIDPIGLDIKKMFKITPSQVHRELEEIFYLQHRRDMRDRELECSAEEFSKSGWRNMYVPYRFHLPLTPSLIPRPLDYFTPHEAELHQEAETGVGKKVYKFWTRGNFLFRGAIILYWISELFPTFHRSQPVYFIRLNDFNEKVEMDLARKNYDYPREFSKTPEIKMQVPVLYDDCTFSIMVKILNLRLYNLEYAHKYRYRSTNTIDKTIFPNFTYKDFDKARRVFLKYDHKLNGFVTFENMCRILNELGNRTSSDARRIEFDHYVDSSYESRLTPSNQIEFEEFLRVYYVLKKPEKEEVLLSTEDLQTINVFHPWGKVPVIPDTRFVVSSFRKGWQYSTIAVGNSLCQNIACGMF